MTYYKVGDPEALVACPYNSTHMVRNKRMQYHLMDCRKQHLHLEMKVCPFNAKHVVPRMELSYHIQHCDDRALIDQDILYQTQLQREQQTGCLVVPQYQDITIDNEEDWDQELHGEPFSLQDEEIKAYCQPVLKPEAVQPRLPKHEPQVLQAKDLESKRQPRHTNATGSFNIEPSSPMAVDVHGDVRLPKTVPKVLQPNDPGTGAFCPLPLGRGSFIARTTAENVPVDRPLMLAGLGRGIAPSSSAISMSSVGQAPPSQGLNRPIGRSSMLVKPEPNAPGQAKPLPSGQKRGPPSSSSAGSTHEPIAGSARQPNVGATRQPTIPYGAPYAIRTATVTTAFSLVGIGRGRGIQIQA